MSSGFTRTGSGFVDGSALTRRCRAPESPTCRRARWTFSLLALLQLGTVACEDVPARVPTIDMLTDRGGDQGEVSDGPVDGDGPLDSVVPSGDLGRDGGVGVCQPAWQRARIDEVVGRRPAQETPFTVRHMVAHDGIVYLTDPENSRIMAVEPGPRPQSWWVAGNGRTRWTEHFQGMLSSGPVMGSAGAWGRPHALAVDPDVASPALYAATIDDARLMRIDPATETMTRVCEAPCIESSTLLDLVKVPRGPWFAAFNIDGSVRIVRLVDGPADLCTIGCEGADAVEIAGAGSARLFASAQHVVVLSGDGRTLTVLPADAERFDAGVPRQTIALDAPIHALAARDDGCAGNQCACSGDGLGPDCWYYARGVQIHDVHLSLRTGPGDFQTPATFDGSRAAPDLFVDAVDRAVTIQHLVQLRPLSLVVAAGRGYEGNKLHLLERAPEGTPEWTATHLAGRLTAEAALLTGGDAHATRWTVPRHFSADGQTIMIADATLKVVREYDRPNAGQAPRLRRVIDATQLAGADAVPPKGLARQPQAGLFFVRDDVEIDSMCGPGSPGFGHLAPDGTASVVGLGALPGDLPGGLRVIRSLAVLGDELLATWGDAIIKRPVDDLDAPWVRFEAGAAPVEELVDVGCDDEAAQEAWQNMRIAADAATGRVVALQQRCSAPMQGLSCPARYQRVVAWDRNGTQAQPWTLLGSQLRMPATPLLSIVAGEGRVLVFGGIQDPSLPGRFPIMLRDISQAGQPCTILSESIVGAVNGQSRSGAFVEGTFSDDAYLVPERGGLALFRDTNNEPIVVYSNQSSQAANWARLGAVGACPASTEVHLLTGQRDPPGMGDRASAWLTAPTGVSTVGGEAGTWYVAGGDAGVVYAVERDRVSVFLGRPLPPDDDERQALRAACLQGPCTRSDFNLMRHVSDVASAGGYLLVAERDGPAVYCATPGDDTVHPLGFDGLPGPVNDLLVWPAEAGTVFAAAGARVWQTDAARTCATFRDPLVQHPFELAWLPSAAGTRILGMAANDTQWALLTESHAIVFAGALPRDPAGAADASIWEIADGTGITAAPDGCSFIVTAGDRLLRLGAQAEPALIELVGDDAGRLRCMHGVATTPGGAVVVTDRCTGVAFQASADP